MRIFWYIKNEGYKYGLADIVASVHLRPYGFIRQIPVGAVTEGRVVGLLALAEEHLLGLRGLEEQGQLVDLVRGHAVCVVAEGLH